MLIWITLRQIYLCLTAVQSLSRKMRLIASCPLNWCEVKYQSVNKSKHLIAEVIYLFFQDILCASLSSHKYWMTYDLIPVNQPVFVHGLTRSCQYIVEWWHLRFPYHSVDKLYENRLQKSHECPAKAQWQSSYTEANIIFFEPATGFDSLNFIWLTTPQTSSAEVKKTK